jgi:hypothetical protein
VYASQKEICVLWRTTVKTSSMTLFATLVVAFSLGRGAVLAQTQPGKETPKPISVTGCLVQGDEPKEVWLAAKDGTIYGLESSNIDLSAHLRQRVIVRGYVLRDVTEGAREGAQQQNKTVKRETADFRVLTLKMISATCNQ